MSKTLGCHVEMKWKDLLTVITCSDLNGLLHDAAGKHDVISHYRDTLCTGTFFPEIFFFFLTPCLFQAAQISHTETNFKQACSFIPLC